MPHIETNIKAETHPAHYMLHKYWGRKPHNVVKEYICKNTKPGDVILDPFMGSGVVVIESLKNNRRAIGIDLNPVACFIAKNTISKWNPINFENEFNDIYNRNFKKYSSLYETICCNCGSKAILQNSIWEKDVLVRIKGICEKCGIFIKNSDNFDKDRLKYSEELFEKLDKEGVLFYPKDEILKYVKRNGKTHLNQFFTKRALIILGTIINEIHATSDINTKNLLLMCFTSMLPNVSKMIPGDIETVNGRSGWVISKLWSPGICTERNIFNSLLSRFNKIKRGKLEIENIIDPSKAKILNLNAENLDCIKSSSVDYIFTDPPYGDSIAYFALSMFWNSWLKYEVDYVNEIIFDPYRNKDYLDYGLRMKKVFKELYRVLKKDSRMSFTFHNRNLNIWKAVMDAVKDAGFHLDNVIYQEQAVSSGTQGLNKKNTLRGDFVYNFSKANHVQSISKPLNNLCSMETIISEVQNWLNKKSNGLTSDELYEKLIPLIVENNLYTDKNGKVIDIEKTLKINFKYGPIDKKYVWQNN